MISCKQVTAKLLNLSSSPGAQSRWGWRLPSVCILLGTERHMETPRLPTPPVNYSLFLCGPFELSICDGYFSQIPTFKWEKSMTKNLVQSWQVVYSLSYDHLRQTWAPLVTHLLEHPLNTWDSGLSLCAFEHYSLYITWHHFMPFVDLFNLSAMNW